MTQVVVHVLTLTVLTMAFAALNGSTRTKFLLRTLRKLTKFWLDIWMKLVVHTKGQVNNFPLVVLATSCLTQKWSKM